MKRIFFLVLFSTLIISVFAQRTNRNNYVTIRFTPNNADWVYKCGETVKLDVSVVRHNVAIPNVIIHYQWGQELCDAILTDSINSGGQGTKTLKLKGSDVPGFMTCEAFVFVDGVRYSNYINVGFEPEKIEPTVKLPSDFQAFWEKTIAAARKVALEPMMTLQPKLCTPFADVYHIRFQNVKAGTYIYGMLSMPKKEGVYPAVLHVPGAGVRTYAGSDKDHFCSRNVINLEIGIHGIPVNLSPQIYADLRANALANYNVFNIDNRDNYYYKRVYVGCIRALDFLCSLPQVDSTRLGVYGGSQGGALSVVVAGLDKRIKCVAANYPALAEIGGFQHGRAAGWPKIFKNPNETNLKQKLNVVAYYDVVNFARFISAPGLYTFGYNDQTCCPTSTYSVYNVITAPKKLSLALDCAHWLYTEQRQEQLMWLTDQLVGNEE